MGISFETALILLALLVVVISLITLRVFINRKRLERKHKQSAQLYTFICTQLPQAPISPLDIRQTKLLKNLDLFEEQYLRACQVIQKQSLQVNAYQYLYEKGRIARALKKLESKRKAERIWAATLLGHLPSEPIVSALELAVQHEKLFLVKLYLANSLATHRVPSSIAVLVDSMLGAPKWYRDKVAVLLVDFGQGFNRYLPEILNKDDVEIVELVILFAQDYVSETLRMYLLNKARSEHVDVSRMATRAMLRNYYYELGHADFLSHTDPVVRATAIESLAMLKTQNNLLKLIDLLADSKTERYAVSAISNIIREEPAYTDLVAARFHDETRGKLKLRLTEILSNRIEYFLLQITSREKKYIKLITQEIISIGKISQIIGFLNKNKDLGIETEVLKTIRRVLERNKELELVDRKEVLIFLKVAKTEELEKEVLDTVNQNLDLDSDTAFISCEAMADYIEKLQNPLIQKSLLSLLGRLRLKTEFRTYLNEISLNKLGYERYTAPRRRRNEQLEREKLKFLQLILVIVGLMFPALFVLRHFGLFAKYGWEALLKLYIIDFNYYLVFYSFGVNLIYLLLMVLSVIGLRKQVKFWKFKQLSFLFKPKVLPSISIIAPAYGEQETIIESVNSLLNLRYPNYELVVVNDGSPDNTLNVLIDYFNLEKIDRVIDESLQTQPIRGIYINKSIGKLTVVDKSNGGKADALNVGINVANNEYFCGIDADSLIESDALMKLAAMTLNDENEGVAMGGNIFPINGCKVHKGHLESKRIPTDHIALFQTIEYIRSFMAGRVGWAHINCLLIISGAFGLFRKQRVIEMGGYLTSSERYKKDTVGEDMELVVRISRSMREQKIPYSIHYSYDANCWTEVPESISILRNQRDRWHRGLIDILNFHKKLLFNRKYGTMGLISMPYFFIFEMIGPLIEMQGYLMVVLAGVFGLLNKQIAILLFIASIGMGVLISITALFIAERQTVYFSRRDLGILVYYSFIENFGPRQYFSFWRAKGYFSAMKKPKGWGKMERKAKLTVTLAFGELEFLTALKTALEKLGFDVFAFIDGRTAMEHITKENPKLVIAEANLPKFDGFKLRERMHYSPTQKFTPFIMPMSTEDQVYEQQLKDLDIVAYRAIPIRVDELANMVVERLAPKSVTKNQRSWVLRLFAKKSAP